MSDDTQTLYAHAVLGADADEFLASELGRTMTGLAQQEAEDALEQLKSIWPWRKRRIQQLQAIIWRAESFEGWLRGLVVDGKMAMQELQERQAE
jgi:hypothetical protein